MTGRPNMGGDSSTDERRTDHQRYQTTRIARGMRKQLRQQQPPSASPSVVRRRRVLAVEQPLPHGRGRPADPARHRLSHGGGGGNDAPLRHIMRKWSNNERNGTTERSYWAGFPDADGRCGRKWSLRENAKRRQIQSYLIRRTQDPYLKITFQANFALFQFHKRLKIMISFRIKS